MGTEILLINSPSQPSPTKNGPLRDRRMPLGLMYVAAHLKSLNLAVTVLDAECLSLGTGDIVARAVAMRPRVIGMNCHTPSRHVVYAIAASLKARLNNVPIILGGAHPSLAPREVLEECPSADLAVVGEGERTLQQLIGCDFKTPELYAIRGIAFRDGRHIVVAEPSKPLQNLDDLPFPDPDMIPFAEYISYEDPWLTGLWHRAYIIASRGCSGTCSFCASASIWKGQVFCRSAENVMAEIIQYRQRHGVNRFYFCDDNILDWRHLPRFCRLCSGLGVFWSCSCTLTMINRELLSTMGTAGCREIAFGLESGSAETLQRIGKNWLATYSEKDVADVIRRCRERDITPRVHFIVGFPWEGREETAETVRLAVRLRSAGLTDANFFPLKCFPGTPVMHDNTRSTETGTRDMYRLYDSVTFRDWYDVKNLKVRSKLARFNDVPAHPLHPSLDSSALRRLIRNAYEVFFGAVDEDEVDAALWSQVAWCDARLP